MVPQAPSAAAKPDSAPRRSYTDAQPRWPVSLSVFGALVVSVLLWVGIVFGVSLLVDWVTGAS